MAITAKEVNTLRKQTGLGLMDCKNALVEAEGDFDKAIDLLRKKGQKIAAKRGDNDAKEGYVIAKVSEDGKNGINIVLNCETDFVAKNAGFADFVNSIADLALAEKPATKEELASLKLDGGSVADALESQMGKIGEKLEISDFGFISAECVVAYNHPGNRTASIIGLSKVNSELGRDLAMQIAAMSPVAVDENGVSEEIKQKELEIGKELAINEGKLAEMADKIAFGRLKKFMKERTLMNQDFIKENKTSVKQYIEKNDNGLTVSAFKLITLA